MTTNLNTPAVAKLIKELLDIGISAYEDCCGLSNVVFIKGENELKICNDMFYRTTGMCMVLECKKGKKKGEEYAKFVPITDDMFYQNIIKADVLTFFKSKENKNENTN